MGSGKANGEILYAGVDIGGTKMIAALATASGKILERTRCSTPRQEPPEATVKALVGLIGEVLDEGGVPAGSLGAIGVAIPGVVDAEAGAIIVTPNANLSGVSMAPQLDAKFGVRVVLANDVNCGTLGEAWLGAARSAQTVVGVFVGTGIGGGVIVDGELQNGLRGAAGEIGHLKMRRGGPLCGCGGRGCLEALASRTAIERDIRDAVAAGRKTVLTELAGGDLSVIRSSLLKRALDQQDELAAEVIGKAAGVLGEACLQIRYVLDPHVIVLGGGVIEACGSFVLPIVEQVMAADPLPGTGAKTRVLISLLGDDAVVLGAVALALQAVGRDPFGETPEPAAGSPTITHLEPGTITVGDKTYSEDIYIRADGKVKMREAALAKADVSDPAGVTAGELKRVCKHGPDLVIIGTGFAKSIGLTDDGERFLKEHGIAFELMGTPKAADAYNAARGRKAAVIHVTG